MWQRWVTLPRVARRRPLPPRPPTEAEPPPDPWAAVLTQLGGAPSPSLTACLLGPPWSWAMPASPDDHAYGHSLLDAVSSVRMPSGIDEQAAIGQVRQLVKEALEAPDAERLAEFLDFTTRFRRLSIWNARMAYIQRPGAVAFATEQEWQSVGRHVAPDAVPVIILWPFGPIRFVYEFADTTPRTERLGSDPFHVAGKLKRTALKMLIKALGEQKTFRVVVEHRRLGDRLAGTAAAQGNLFGTMGTMGAVADGSRLGDMLQPAAATVRSGTVMRDAAPIPVFRVVINDRMSPAEQFVTLAHELAHIFCGHLGGCQGFGREDEESGWPDRRSVSKAMREVEAESVAYLVAARSGLVTNSAEYLRGYVEKTGEQGIAVELIVRAAARIERLAKIHHGTMRFDVRATPDLNRAG